LTESAKEPGLAVVTGASSGIGEAFARELRRRGFRLVLVARRPERLARLADELGGPQAAHAVACDLSASGAAFVLAREVAARGLKADLVVNNAGIGHTGRFIEAPPETLGAVVDLDVRAAQDVCRAFLPAMVERGSGTLINVVSMSAFQPVPYLATYAASKAFLLSLTEALATELAGTGVRVQALCPGLVPTEFQARAGTDRVPFNRSPKQSPAWVARVSLDALEHGRLVVIPGWRDRLSVFAQRFAPRGMARRVGAALFRPQAGRADEM
jgi:hypothetical protein